MAWITNGKVAWEIPGGRIAKRFLDKMYIPPEGWEVTRVLDAGVVSWAKGECGEMRREVESAS